MSTPFTLDLKAYYDNKIKDIPAALESMKRNFGVDKLPYSFTHTNLGTGITQSDIFYKDLEVGHVLIWRKFNGLNSKCVKIEVTHKFNGVIFFKELKTNANYYVDCVSHLFGLYGDTYKEKFEDKYTLPTYIFYPAEVVVPDYVDISEAKFPKQTKITKIK